jgi:DNA-binding HxlR family transcriptional regulator
MAFAQPRGKLAPDTMQHPKSYKQFCGVAKALDVVGERWTLLVVRDLILGPLRYSDLQRNLVGITPNLLSKRLRDLTDAGVITKSAPPERLYQLTDLGRRLEPVVLGLGAFGAQFMTAPERDDRIDPRAAALSLRRRYQGSIARGRALFRFGEDTFYVEFAGPKLAVRAMAEAELHPPPKVDCELAGDFGAWFPLLSGRQSFRELQKAGALSRRGSAQVASRLIRDLGLKP